MMLSLFVSLTIFLYSLCACFSEEDIKAFPSRADMHLSNRVRNITILIDHDHHEDVGNRNVALLVNLLAVLEEKQTCLVSTSLWHTFLEKRFELEHRGRIKDTEEYKCIRYFSLIKKEIAQLSEMLKKYDNYDKQQNHKIITTIINQKFFEPLALEENKSDIPNTDSWNVIRFLLPYYLTTFNPEEWDIYAVNNHFRLLVPKHTNLNDGSTQNDQHSSQYTAREQLLGLKVDHLKRDIYAYDTTHLIFEEDAEEESPFVQVLNDVFMKKSDNSSCIWNIILRGHGYNSNGDTAQSCASITSLSVKEFKDFLQFLEHEIDTNVLFYTSCYSGGQHLSVPYMSEEVADVYSYTIMSACLADGVCVEPNPRIPHIFCLDRKCLAPRLLTIEDIRWKKSINQYEFKINHPFRYKRFYKMVSRPEIVKDPYKLLASTVLVNNSLFQSIVWVRYPGKKQFVMVCPFNVVKIDGLTVAVHEAYKRNISCSIENMIAIDTPYISMPLIIEGEQRPINIYSVAAGNSVHLFQELEVPLYNLNQCAQLFSPLMGLSFIKIFLINKLTIAHDPSMPLERLLSPSEGIITLHKVIISMSNDSLMRMMFETSDGREYCAYGRHINKEVMEIRALEPLNPEGVKYYKDQWNVLKRSALDQAAYNTQPLYESLQEALAKMTASSTL